MRTVGLAQSAFIGLSDSGCACESSVSLSVSKRRLNHLYSIFNLKPLEQSTFGMVISNIFEVGL